MINAHIEQRLQKVIHINTDEVLKLVGIDPLTHRVIHITQGHSHHRTFNAVVDPPMLEITVEAIEQRIEPKP